MNAKPILIVGLPRSGTTWIGSVFSAVPNTFYVFEPDNEKLSPAAWLCKRKLHRFPYLTPQDEAANYALLWRAALETSLTRHPAYKLLKRWFTRTTFAMEVEIGERCGWRHTDVSYRHVRPNVRPYRVATHPFIAALTWLLLHTVRPHREPARRIVKSVHSLLSLEWLAARFPLQVVVVLRNPYSLYASYKRLRMPDAFRNLRHQAALRRDWSRYFSFEPVMRWEAPPSPKAAVQQILVAYRILAERLPHHPEWVVISHDRLCMAPTLWRELFERLSLPWGEPVESRLADLDRPGEGFIPKRITRSQPFKWQQELTSEEQAMIAREIRHFDLDAWMERYVNWKR